MIRTKFVFISILISILISISILTYKNETFLITMQPKKIALCFLIYDKINNEELWWDFIKNIDKNKYNIYIHFKNTTKSLKYFEKYKLKNTIDTCWGCFSIVLAQNLILKEAIKDDKNQHFIWLSGSCIPLKSFDYIYKYLDTTKSYYNMSPNEQVFPRANNALLYINKDNIKKASMASIINRKHAKLFIKYEPQIELWFKNINNVDEIAYITMLHHLNLQNELVLTPNIAAGAIIFTSWSDMSNYKLFKNSTIIENKAPNNYKYICAEELDYLLKSNSLFGRKFEDKCGGLERLIWIK